MPSASVIIPNYNLTQFPRQRESSIAILRHRHLSASNQRRPLDLPWTIDIPYFDHCRWLKYGRNMVKRWLKYGRTNGASTV